MDDERNTKTFKMRINEDDDKNFIELAKVLHRSKSDALRFMARVWVQTLKGDDESTNPAEQRSLTDGLYN